MKNNIDKKLGILSVSHFEMPENDPPIITPTHVIFREIDYDINGGHFTFSRRDLRVDLAKTKNLFSTDRDMMNFISNKGKISLGEESQSKIEGDLDFSVRINAYVVISIKSGFHWSFDKKKKGVTLGDNKYINYYENLQHYDSINNRLTPGGFDGCRHVIFSAKPLPKTAGGDTIQSINFNLVDAHGTQITVDPDIRFPGNTGFTEGEAIS